jgi:hypothetical protein
MRQMSTRKRKKARVLERGLTVSHPGEVLGVPSERHEIGHATLPDEQGCIPALFWRADEKRAAPAAEEQASTARAEEGLRVLHVRPIYLLVRDGPRRRQVGGRGVVGHVAKTQKVQHDDLARDAAHHERSSSSVCRFQVSVVGHGQLLITGSVKTVYGGARE